MKNIETLLSSIVLKDINCVIIANWDIGDFVYFWDYLGYGDRFFWDFDFEQWFCGARQGKYRQAGGIFGSACQMWPMWPQVTKSGSKNNIWTEWYRACIFTIGLVLMSWSFWCGRTSKTDKNNQVMATQRWAKSGHVANFEPISGNFSHSELNWSFYSIKITHLATDWPFIQNKLFAKLDSRNNYLLPACGYLQCRFIFHIRVGVAIDTPTLTPKILSFRHVENVEKIAYL